MFAMVPHAAYARGAMMLYTEYRHHTDIVPRLGKSRSSMRHRFFVVENPGAGVTGSPLVEDAVRLLAKGGGSVRRAQGAGSPAARLAVREAARSGSFDAIVAAGGDGTIRNA